MAVGHSVSGVPSRATSPPSWSTPISPGHGLPSARVACASRAFTAVIAAGSAWPRASSGMLSPMMMDPARWRRSMVAAWAAGSVPAYAGISTCPAFSSTDIAATAAAATFRSRCSGPQPSGVSAGSGEESGDGSGEGEAEGECRRRTPRNWRRGRGGACGCRGGLRNRGAGRHGGYGSSSREEEGDSVNTVTGPHEQSH